jgi:hypothetical protein
MGAVELENLSEAELMHLTAFMEDVTDRLSQERRLPAPVLRGRIRAHLLWELRQMMAAMPPDDLTNSELAAAVAVLQAAHARAIAPPTEDRPIFRIVPKALNGLGIGSS